MGIQKCNSKQILHCWIDFEKYKPSKIKWDDPVFSKYDEWVQEALNKVKLKLKENEVQKETGSN